MDTLCFEPSFGGLKITYDVHLVLIGKRVVDFLLVLIELFRYVLQLRRYMGENRSKIGVLKADASNFHAEEYVPTNHFCTDS